MICCCMLLFLCFCHINKRMERDLNRKIDIQTEVKKLKSKSTVSHSAYTIPARSDRRKHSDSLSTTHSHSSSMSIEGKPNNATHAEMIRMKQPPKKKLVSYLSSPIPRSPDSDETQNSVNSDVSKLSALSTAVRFRRKQKKSSIVEDDGTIHIKHVTGKTSPIPLK